MACKWLYFSNLPFDITKEKFVEQLVTTFPKEFQDAHRLGNLKVDVFLPMQNQRGQKRKGARATGFMIDFEAFKLKTSQHQLLGRNWVVHLDRGDERDKFGSFVKKINPEKRRALMALEGCIIKKATFIFRESFLNTIGVAFSKTSVVFVQGVVSRELMATTGRVLNYIHLKATGITKVVYSSTLEALQTIMLLNGVGSIRFCNEIGEQCNYFDQKGLGKNGEVLVINQNYKGKQQPVFFEKLADIIDVDIINSMKSVCWKCKQKYIPIGVDPNLQFVAAKCKCKYDSNLDVADSDRGYFWKEELFTRLILGFKDKENQFGYQWSIWHEQMKEKYDSSIEFRNIVAPIMQEEWKYRSKEFKSKNQCIGKLLRYQSIEETKAEKLYSVVVSVQRNNFWNLDALHQTGKITLEFSCNYQQNKACVLNEKRKTTLCGISEDFSDIVNLYLRMCLDKKKSLIPQCSVIMTPKPIKSQYTNARRVLKLFATKPKGTYPALEQICLKESTLKNSLNSEDYLRKNEMHKAALFRLKRNTNEEQKNALANAESSPLSIIQGPPGTGKTYLGSVISLALALSEKGHIIYTAPSYYAVEGAVRRLDQLIQKAKIPLRVLFIFSKKREHELLAAKRHIDLGQSVGILHQLVRSSHMWLAGKNFDTIRKNVEENRRDLLTTVELELLRKHEEYVEKNIFQQYHIFVLTVGCLDDKRVLSYGKPDKIGTVVVDECGQLMQSSAIQIFIYNQRRTVLVGDQLQLRAQVDSFGSDFAGLGYSVMDWLNVSKSVNWIMLTEQHRMNTDNRQVVSDLTYGSKLKDAVQVLKQPTWVFDIKALFETQISSQVLTFNHTCVERQVGTSFINEGEVALTVHLCSLLLKTIVKPNQITVLTLYEAQRSRLEQSLKEQDVAVRNVDAFQGRENDIIILSLVRGGTKEIGFGSNINRINVSISRSKHFLFVLCNMDTFKNHPSQNIKKLLELLNGKDVIVPIRTAQGFIFNVK